MKPIARNLLCILIAAAILSAAAVFGLRTYQGFQSYSYPQKYANLVESSAKEYGLDPLLIYSFIRTESGFDANAESNVGARGLMQITEVTFDWIKSQIAADEAVTFDDLYNPATNIRFGCYYLMRCLTRYSDDISTAAAAYHSGWGTVDTLLQNTDYSSDGLCLDLFPYQQMHNYVSKIQKAYQKYQSLYNPEGETKQ